MVVAVCMTKVGNITRIIGTKEVEISLETLGVEANIIEVTGRSLRKETDICYMER